MIAEMTHLRTSSGNVVWTSCATKPICRLLASTSIPRASSFQSKVTCASSVMWWSGRGIHRSHLLNKNLYRTALEKYRAKMKQVRTPAAQPTAKPSSAGNYTNAIPMNTSTTEPTLASPERKLTPRTRRSRSSEPASGTMCSFSLRSDGVS